MLGLFFKSFRRLSLILPIKYCNSNNSCYSECTSADASKVICHKLVEHNKFTWIKEMQLKIIFCFKIWYRSCFFLSLREENLHFVADLNTLQVSGGHKLSKLKLRAELLLIIFRAKLIKYNIKKLFNKCCLCISSSL